MASVIKDAVRNVIVTVAGRAREHGEGMPSKAVLITRQSPY